jgi:PEP-CTERM motif
MRLLRTLTAFAGLSLCPLSAHATTFVPGEFITWSQVEWGGDPEPGTISFSLEQNFNSLFAPSDLLKVGISNAPGFSIIFDSADAIINYLPSGGSPGALTATLLDPVTTASGALGGEVVTAALNIAFSDAGLLAHPAGVPFGDLLLENLDALVGNPIYGGVFGPEIAELDGMSVREFFSDAEFVLGGGGSPLTPEETFRLLNYIDMSFNGGPVSTFATEFLALPYTAPTAPEPSTWAMLLIGFAGLGFAGWRTSRRAPPPPARSA